MSPFWLRKVALFICVGLIAFNTGEACAKTPCFSVHARKKIEMFSLLTSKLLLIRMTFLAGKTTDSNIYFVTYANELSRIPRRMKARLQQHSTTWRPSGFFFERVSCSCDSMGERSFVHRSS